MKKCAGIWIDTKKAVIVFLGENNPNITHIYSNIDNRERIAGESRSFSRVGDHVLNADKTKENRKNNEIREYLKNVLKAARNAEELFLFGPAEMKKELEKLIREDASLSSKLKAVKSADSMTDNQVVATVKEFYQNNRPV